MTRVSRSGRAVFGLRRTAASAGDSVSELSVEELAADSAEEGHRHEYGAQNGGDRDDRSADLLHRLMGRCARSFALLDVPLDVLHYDDRVIYDDADREHQSEQGEGIDREAEQEQHGKRPHDRHRHGEQGDEGRAPRL